MSRAGARFLENGRAVPIIYDPSTKRTLKAMAPKNKQWWRATEPKTRTPQLMWRKNGLRYSVMDCILNVYVGLKVIGLAIPNFH